MSHARLWLLAFFLLIHVLIAVWDIVAVIRGRPADTVSATLLDWSMAYPILAFIVGLVCGHVFWPQPVIIQKILP